jgi:tRNA A-37 threonylcarbamoyl transferase component Bud32
MQTLDHASWLALRKDAKVIEADGSGDKVLQTADGRFIKLFRRKRLWTSAALFPYAQRFADNASALLRQGIAAPQVLAVYRVKSIARDAVYYEPLPGQTLRQVLGDTALAEPLREQYGAFVADLHQRGVYFRSLHLGNVVITEDRTLGLIDIADLSCGRRALSQSKRLRNFQHMLRYRNDRQWLQGDNRGQTFLAGYRQTLGHAFLGDRLMRRLSAALAPISDR